MVQQDSDKAEECSSAATRAGKSLASRLKTGPAVAGAVIDLVDVVEANADGIIVLDAEGKYLFVNLRAEQILATSRAELLGEPAWMTFPDPGADGSAFRQHFDRAANQRVDTAYESFLPSISRWLQVRLVPCAGHRNPEGFEHGITVYFHDVTARAEAEQRRRDMVRLPPMCLIFWKRIRVKLWPTSLPAEFWSLKA